MENASAVPSQRVDPLGSRATEGTLRCISHNHMVILLLLHALYDLFTSTKLETGLARCLTTFFYCPYTTRL